MFSFSAFEVASSEIRRPNILYIYTDDQSARTIGCYPDSYAWVETPNIDRLAEQGVRFTYAYTGPKCVPSRGTALTGNFQHNFTRQSDFWPANFRKNGYYTGMIGKWHWDLPRHESTWDWSAVWEHHLPENLRNYYWNQSLRIHGDTLLKLEQYSTDAYTDLTIDFLKERAKEPGQPWYFWVCFGAVHGPYTPADRHIGSYEEAPEMEYPKDIYAPRPDKPENMIHLETNKKDPKTGKPMYRNRTLDSWVKQYNEAVRAIDEGVGRIMEALEKTGQLNNTIVIFTSDNGYAWGHHGYNAKLAPYDANQLVPLIFVNHGTIPAGKVSDVPVNGVDLIATIHALGEVEPANPIDGRDLSNIIFHPEGDALKDEPMIQIYTGGNYGNERIRTELEKAHQTGDWIRFEMHPPTGSKTWMMLRQGKYKYVRYIYKDYIEELYDLENDPEELVNLAVRNDHRDRLYHMRTQLLTEFKKRGAEFLDLLPQPLEKTMN
jgi:arylsulfatase A-like enzyme